MTTSPPANHSEVVDERPQRRREYTGAGSTLGVAFLIVITVGLAIWYFEFREDSFDTSGDGAFGVVDFPPDVPVSGGSPAAREGRTAPNFRLQSPDGEVLTLADFRGGYVLVNFWASWCGPCSAEAPDLEAVSRKPGSRLTVIGVNQQEEPSEVTGFRDRFQLTYPLVMDRNGEVSEAYRVDSGLPVSFLLSPAGVVLEIYRGRVTTDDLARITREFLQ